jgi:hypothetical protein
MGRIGFSVIVLLAACGSSQNDGGPTDDPGQQSSGGGAGASLSGSSGRTGVTTGTAGGMGTAGATGGGGSANAGTGGMTGGGGAIGKGGAAGSAGAANPCDAGVVVVRACDGLPAAGQWQNITPPPFKNPTNMETLAVVVNPLDQTIYAAAGNKTNGGNGGTGVYKSTDCGATFTFVSTGTNKDKLMSGDPWAMMIDPTHPDTLYTNNGYGNDPTIYKSTNAGVDWTGLSPHPTWKLGSHVQAIAMEPSNPQHLAVTFHTTCEAPYNGLCLSRSNDGGTTWAVFNGPTQLTGWQEAATISVVGPTSYVYAATSGGWYTADEGQTWTKVIPDTFYSSYAGSTDLAPDGTLYLSGANSIYKSQSNPLGKTWTKIDGSPRTTVIIDDGMSLFASGSWADANPVYTSMVSNSATWTNMKHTGRGANQLAYDAGHHIVYAANWGNGLWRLVTR